MTKMEAQKEFEAGGFIALGEYRNSKSELLRWRDRESGKPMEAPILRHSVEFGNTSVHVNERVPDGVKLEDIKVPFAKGDLVVLRLEEYTSTKGLVSVRGRLEKLQGANGSSGEVGQTSARAPRTGL